jgi:hypothetical protein
LRRAIFAKPNLWRCTIQLAYADVLNFKQKLPLRRDARLNQIFQHFVLRVDHHCFAAGEFPKINLVAPARKLQFNPAMHEPLPHHARAYARFVQQIHRALFENPCAHPFLDVLPAARFQHNRLDSLQMQKVREHQTGRPSPDNSYLSSHKESLSVRCNRDEMLHGLCSAITSSAIWNAELAAGNPQ